MSSPIYVWSVSKLCLPHETINISGGTNEGYRDENKHGVRGQEQLKLALLRRGESVEPGPCYHCKNTNIKIFKTCFWTPSILWLTRARAFLFITLLTEWVFNTSAAWQDSFCGYLSLREHLAPSTATQYNEISDSSKSCEFQICVMKRVQHLGRFGWIIFSFFPSVHIYFIRFISVPFSFSSWM